MHKISLSRKRQGENYHYMTVLLIFLGFFVMALILLGERHGLSAGGHDFSGSMLSAEELASLDTGKPVSSTGTCLFLWDSESVESAASAESLRQILLDMRVSVKEVDVSAQKVPEELADYETIVAALPDLDVLGEDVLRLCAYVEDGGRLLFADTMTNSQTYIAISERFGVIGTGAGYKAVHGFACADGFMAGGDGRTFALDGNSDTAYDVRLDGGSIVYMWDSEDRTPLIWERDYGEGRFVVCNIGLYSKTTRGFYAAAYSLLEDTCVWPVINASSFYLDDFPAPVPEGDAYYIERDYGMDTASFYADVWWPDVLKLAETYGIRYSGMIIETYDSQVSGTLRRNWNTANHRYYGDMLLDAGGELGLHGYNHQPLVGEDYVYQDDLGYEKWESPTQMKAAMDELYDFSTSLFPDTTFDVYVPPSNILSEEARGMIGEGQMTGVRAVASTYHEGEDVYIQEFEVAEDGIIECPRVISGCIFDKDARLAAFSELNLHYVSSHFMHPDDLMDPDRGADLGWEELKSRLTGYLDYLQTAAPGLTMAGASGMAGRVQRFSCLYVESKEETEDGVSLTFDGLADEGWCLVRCNSGTPSETVTGGELTPVTGNLYLLHVTSPQVYIPYV